MTKAKRILRRLKRRFSPTPEFDDKVRLHLGCGDDYWPGYVNVDTNQAADSDKCMDFLQIAHEYAAGSVSEVVMIHSLSYLRLWEARDLFKDIFRLMETGGRLIIELPDLAKCAQKVLEAEWDLESYVEAVRGIYAFGLNQIAHRDMYTPYSFGWSGWHLKYELEKVGFRQITICDPQTHGPKIWRDTRIEAEK